MDDLEDAVSDTYIPEDDDEDESPEMVTYERPSYWNGCPTGRCESEFDY